MSAGSSEHSLVLRYIRHSVLILAFSWGTFAAIVTGVVFLATTWRTYLPSESAAIMAFVAYFILAAPMAILSSVLGVGVTGSLVIASRPAVRGLVVRSLLILAGLLAGRRHAHLRDAWAADLYGEPDGVQLPSAQRLKLAAGDVVAALRCRLDDAADLIWQLVDGLLSSWHGSNLTVLMPVTIALGLIMSREGCYGLINNADNLGVIAAAPYAVIKGLRKYRQIDTPKRPEKKDEKSAASTGDPEKGA
jgi:hypothetical protein